MLPTAKLQSIVPESLLRAHRGILSPDPLHYPNVDPAPFLSPGTWVQEESDLSKVTSCEWVVVSGLDSISVWLQSPQLSTAPRHLPYPPVCLSAPAYLVVTSPHFIFSPMVDNTSIDLILSPVCLWLGGRACQRHRHMWPIYHHRQCPDPYLART